MKNKHFYLNEETLNYINDLKNKYKLSSASKTLEKIIEEHKEFSNSYNQKEIENTEINTQIIIEMLNCLFIYIKVIVAFKFIFFKNSSSFIIIPNKVLITII